MAMATRQNFRSSGKRYAAAGAGVVVAAAVALAVNAANSDDKESATFNPTTSPPSLTASAGTSGNPSNSKDPSQAADRFNSALKHVVPGIRPINDDELRYETLPEEGLIGGWTAVLKPFTDSSQEVTIRINRWALRPDWSTASCAVLKEENCSETTKTDGSFLISGFRDVTAEAVDSRRTQSYAEPWARTVTPEGLIVEVSATPAQGADGSSEPAVALQASLTLQQIQNLSESEELQLVIPS